MTMKPGQLDEYVGSMGMVRVLPKKGDGRRGRSAGIGAPYNILCVRRVLGRWDEGCG